MIRNRNLNTQKFDPNLYNAEKDKQKIEVKAKLNKEEEERKRKLKQTNDEKNVTKIQINFKNSYIDKDLKNTYKNMIEENKKENLEKQTTTKVETKNDDNESINISEINDTIANRSEIVVIESMASKGLNATSQLNDTSQINESRLLDTTNKQDYSYFTNNQDKNNGFNIVPINKTIRMDDTMRVDDTVRVDDESNLGNLDATVKYDTTLVKSVIITDRSGLSIGHANNTNNTNSIDNTDKNKLTNTHTKEIINIKDEVENDNFSNNKMNTKYNNKDSKIIYKEDLLKTNSMTNKNVEDEFEEDDDAYYKNKAENEEEDNNYNDKRSNRNEDDNEEEDNYYNNYDNNIKNNNINNTNSANDIKKIEYKNPYDNFNYDYYKNEEDDNSQDNQESNGEDNQENINNQENDNHGNQENEDYYEREDDDDTDTNLNNINQNYNVNNNNEINEDQNNNNKDDIELDDYEEKGEEVINNNQNKYSDKIIKLTNTQYKEEPKQEPENFVVVENYDEQDKTPNKQVDNNYNPNNVKISQSALPITILTTVPKEKFERVEKVEINPYISYCFTKANYPKNEYNNNPLISNDNMFYKDYEPPEIEEKQITANTKSNEINKEQNNLIKSAKQPINISSSSDKFNSIPVTQSYKFQTYNNSNIENKQNMENNNKDEENPNQDEEIEEIEEIKEVNQPPIEDEIEIELSHDYNKFLEESIRLKQVDKNDIQHLLRNQMKNIISDLKHRKVEKKVNKNDRKKILLENVNFKFDDVVEEEEGTNKKQGKVNENNKSKVLGKLIKEGIIEKNIDAKLEK